MGAMISVLVASSILQTTPRTFRPIHLKVEALPPDVFADARTAHMTVDADSDIVVLEPTPVLRKRLTKIGLTCYDACLAADARAPEVRVSIGGFSTVVRTSERSRRESLIAGVVDRLLSARAALAGRRPRPYLVECVTVPKRLETDTTPMTFTQPLDRIRIESACRAYFDSVVRSVERSPAPFATLRVTRAGAVREVRVPTTISKELQNPSAVAMGRRRAIDDLAKWTSSAFPVAAPARVTYARPKREFVLERPAMTLQIGR